MVDLGFCVLVLHKVRHAYNPVCPNHMVIKQDLHFFFESSAPFKWMRHRNVPTHGQSETSLKYLTEVCIVCDQSVPELPACLLKMQIPH